MSATDTLTGDCVTSSDQRDDERLAALYNAHVVDVYRYVHRMCLDHAVAEDVTQDVFVALLRESDVDVSVGWLMRSARNRLIDIVRRESSYRDKVRVLTGGTRSSGGDEPGAVVESLSMSESLAKLRPEHRISLMLHYVDGCSVADLAQALGRSYKGAEGLLARARTALRTELELEAER